MLGSEGSGAPHNELRPGSQETWSPVLTGSATRASYLPSLSHSISV